MVLDMFRAMQCSSSGGQILHLQHLVSPLSVCGRTVHRLRADCSPWAGQGRDQSSVRLHPGQILRGSLPLLSPAFIRSHFRFQVPPRPPRRERSQRRKVELWARIVSGNFAEMTTSTLHLGIFNMPQIYDMGPTALLPLRRKAC